MNIVDDCTRERLAIEVHTSLTGRRVVAVLQRLAEARGLPLPGWDERELLAVLERPRVERLSLDLRSGKRKSSRSTVAFATSGLTETWFVTMARARRVIEHSRIEHNEDRPHPRLGYLTPARYAATLTTKRKKEAFDN